MRIWYCQGQYLPLLQSHLALLLAADERPVAPEHSVSSVNQMCESCWEETNPVFNYPLENTIHEISSHVDFCDIYVKFGIREPGRHARFLTHLPPILVGVISQ